MHLHEYQAKLLLKKYSIPMPDFQVISNINELEEALKALNTDQVVLKVQVHAGGRGKAGGVKLAKNLNEAQSFAKDLLGMKIVSRQTGKQGVIAEKILLSTLVDCKKEFYLGAIIDRKSAHAVLICSPEGGVEIEEVAAKNPEKILKTTIPLNGKIPSYHLIEIAKFMGWKGKLAAEGMKICQAVAKAFLELDASLLEINPLVQASDESLLALDAKLTIDDNALFRHKDLLQYYDPSQVSPLEAEAEKQNLSYVALDGEIGCMVNGAGLAMATMDIIDHFGGRPANFLDVGGGASEDKVAEGFAIILSDPNVKAILVNIFGGILNCATLAAGLIAAASKRKVNVPLIVRLEGTNVEEGKKMLASSGLAIEIADGLSDAAEKAVKAGRGQ